MKIKRLILAILGIIIFFSNFWFWAWVWDTFEPTTLVYEFAFFMTVGMAGIGIAAGSIGLAISGISGLIDE